MAPYFFFFFFFYFIIIIVNRQNVVRAEVVERLIGDLPVVRLPGGQAEPDREALFVDDDLILVVSPPFTNSDPDPTHPLSAINVTRKL